MVITLTTDFGPGSGYVAQMKGVIFSINPAVTVVDISHDVAPQDIRQAALLLDDAGRWFPPGSIHVAVIDPGVGTERAIVLAQVDSQWYIAPDNGLLSLVVRRSPARHVVAVTNAEFWLPQVSATFHGRDVMAPVAAHLSRGVPPGSFGPAHDELISLDWPAARRAAGHLQGEVITLDTFGNAVTNITAEMLGAIPDRAAARVQVQGDEITGLSRTYGDAAGGAPLALVGSSGRLEIAIAGGSAAAKWNLRIGDAVHVRWA